MSSTTRFEFGDRVRHRMRPEWGVGSVVRAEETTINGRRAQRVAVRFPNAGLKTLSSAHADLERVEALPQAAVHDDRPSVATLDRMRESWLGSMAEKKIEQVMISLPEEVRDPFSSLQRRLKLTLDLYRFDRSGRGLVDWAIAQSGLDDPLSRFSRQELEQHFDRWAAERDAHLRRLIQEARNGVDLKGLVAGAPAGARAAVQRIIGGR